MYGTELRYTALQNWKGRLVYMLLGETHPGYRLRFWVNRRATKLRALSKNPLHILEMGSANGAFSFWLGRNRAYTVIGLEYNELLVRDCEQIRKMLGRKNQYFVCADVTSPFPLRKKFDIIFSTHVLEHIKDDQDALSAAYNHLNQNGLLFVQVPFGDPHKQPSPEEAHNGHIREGYTTKDLYEKAKAAGFEVVFVGGCIGRAGYWAWQLGHRLGKVPSPVSLEVLFFPLINLLIGLEQIAAFFRKNHPPPQNGLLMVARRPFVTS